MKTYAEFIKVNESAVVSKEKWGVEITGTVADVMRELASQPADGECIASVVMKGWDTPKPNTELRGEE